MKFAAVVDRVRGDFTEMPGLELTMGQAIRLWNMGADDCRFALDSMVDAGFLRWTAKRTIVRADRAWSHEVEPQYSYISVRQSRASDTPES